MVAPQKRMGERGVRPEFCQRRAGGVREIFKGVCDTKSCQSEVMAAREHVLHDR